MDELFPEVEIEPGVMFHPYGSTIQGFNGPPDQCPPGAVPLQAMNPDDVLTDGTLRAGASVIVCMSDGKGGTVECKGRYLGPDSDWVKID